MQETGVNNIIFIFQVLHQLWHVPLLHSWHWTWLEGRNQAIQVHWALLGINWWAKATMANFSCTSSTWLLIWYRLCSWRIIRGTNGEGEPVKLSKLVIFLELKKKYLWWGLLLQNIAVLERMVISWAKESQGKVKRKRQLMIIY